MQFSVKHIDIDAERNRTLGVRYSARSVDSETVHTQTTEWRINNVHQRKEVVSKRMHFHSNGECLGMNRGQVIVRTVTGTARSHHGS